MEELLWRIGGQSGEGIESSGEVLARALHALGYYVYGFREFPSRIRGGHTHFTLRASSHPVRHPGDAVSVLVALDQESIDRNRAELTPEAYILYDADRFTADCTPNPAVHLVPLPLSGIARQLGEPLLRNVAGVGATVALFGLSPESVRTALVRQWARKGEQVVDRNHTALQRGYEALRQACPQVNLALPPPPAAAGPRYLLTGNDAIALGALFGGCRFLAAYPITPASEVLHELAAWLPGVGGVAVQAEDELAALNMAIGAGYAGARAMTSTSGPGFSLMMEALGLAGMAEVPVVLVDVQRGGPSTGMPTKLEQSDLYQAVYGSHGEIPRVVLTPATVEDAFYQTAEAFQLAEAYQCPVILLSDAAIGQATQTVENLNLERLSLLGQAESALLPVPGLANGVDGNGVDAAATVSAAGRYPRYAVTASGISARPLPGQAGGLYLATGNEHDAYGQVTDAADNRQNQMDKRMRKLAHLSPPSWVSYTGSSEPDLLLVGWGAATGALVEARQALVEQGVVAGLLTIRGLRPFPRHQVEPWLQQARQVLVVEHNHEGQLEHLLRSECAPSALARVASLRQYNGRPFRVGAIVAKALELLATLSSNTVAPSTPTPETGISRDTPVVTGRSDQRGATVAGEGRPNDESIHVG